MSVSPIAVSEVRSEGSAVSDDPEALEVLGEPRLSSHPHPNARAQSGSPDSKQMLASRRRPGGRRWGDAGGAYRWWAAGSQGPGSRALRTALLRRALSW